MNGKASKKIRQLYHKTVFKEARSMGRTIGNAMKPKPKFIPMWLWIKMISCFIYIDKTGVKK